MPIRLGFVSRAAAKIRGKLGGDTTATRTYERPLYEYNLVREVTTVQLEGHRHHWDKGTFVVEEANDEEWARRTIQGRAMKPLYGGYDEVERVTGVTDWEREDVGVTAWEITVDVAEGAIVDVSRTVERS